MEEQGGSKGEMTVREAGRKGGRTTSERHGRQFFEEIGRKGGKRVSRDRAHMAKIGRKGGGRRRQTKEPKGSESA